jgi:hypothetical protein
VEQAVVLRQRFRRLRKKETVDQRREILQGVVDGKKEEVPIIPS